MASHTASQRYLSTRGGSKDLSFEAAVLKGLADDGGLFIPEEIPSLPDRWQDEWSALGFEDLAFHILSLYISPSEIVPVDLKELIKRSYSTFRDAERTPIRTIRKGENLHVLELFHGPTFAFKDVALQFLGNLFEYFLNRKNQAALASEPERLTVIGATSGDTGSAAIYGLRGKKNVSVFILFPTGKVSPVQEAQMTSVLDANVHNISVGGTFDDCQDIVKQLFADKEFNEKHKLGAVNSINWARILAQITYYFHSYFTLLRQYPETPRDQIKIRYAVPTGNFGDVLAGYFAKRMGLPIDRLIISTNANDILDRFWKSGRYEMRPVHGQVAEGGLVEDGAKAHEEGVKETLSPAMDILVSSNFERLLWYLALEKETPAGADLATRQAKACEVLKKWMTELKSSGLAVVSGGVLEAAKRDFACERVSDEETIKTIREIYNTPDASDSPYILDPHTSVGVTAAIRDIANNPDPSIHRVCLATAHPAKFSHAVDLSLNGIEGYSFDHILPKEFKGLLSAEKRVEFVEKPDKGLVKETIDRLLAYELGVTPNGSIESLK